jgi:hypothetical protein
MKESKFVDFEILEPFIYLNDLRFCYVWSMHRNYRNDGLINKRTIRWTREESSSLV